MAAWLADCHKNVVVCNDYHHAKFERNWFTNVQMFQRMFFYDESIAAVISLRFTNSHSTLIKGFSGLIAKIYHQIEIKSWSFQLVICSQWQSHWKWCEMDEVNCAYNLAQTQQFWKNLTEKCTCLCPVLKFLPCKMHKWIVGQQVGWLE